LQQPEDYGCIFIAALSSRAPPAWTFPDRVDCGKRREKSAHPDRHKHPAGRGQRARAAARHAFDGQRIVSSSEALRFDSVPRHLGIVGGGYIGLELGSVWLRLGAKVSVLEMLPKIGTGLDGQVARSLDRILRKQGMDLRLATRVVEAKTGKNEVRVTVEKEDRREELTFDRLLVSVGRRPLTRGLGLAELGIIRKWPRPLKFIVF
jgi:pyruvate/2-oxoglutarate dehydrogenase complex dihydrolipoamide dehydrogenase (E3) component